MATPKKRKGHKGSSARETDPSNEPMVAEVPPELTPPVSVPGGSNPPPPTVRVERKPESLPKVIVSPIIDPKAKSLVTGKVSGNFTYGGQSVCLLNGKQTRIPSTSVEHFRRLKYI